MSIIIIHNVNIIKRKKEKHNNDNDNNEHIDNDNNNNDVIHDDHDNTKAAPKSMGVAEPNKTPGAAQRDPTLPIG